MEETKIKIICYDEERMYPQADRARLIREFADAVDACDGAEKERYANILSDLIHGRNVCRDEY